MQRIVLPALVYVTAVFAVAFALGTLRVLLLVPYLGTGPGAGLHHPAFDFNDEAAPIGASFFARVVERKLAIG